jgi:hypothetical protein
MPLDKIKEEDSVCKKGTTYKPRGSGEAFV